MHSLRFEPSRLSFNNNSTSTATTLIPQYHSHLTLATAMNCSTRVSRSLPQSSLFRRAHPTSQQCVCLVQQSRAESTSRRSKTALRVRPAESFSVHSSETTDHIIYNPPSSAPNVYHTPMKFLPKSDPRRKLHTLSMQPATSSTTITPSSSPTSLSAAPSLRSPLPPPVRPRYEKKYHLNQADVDEIRRLRDEDPKLWTRVRLAEKFGCSQFFVSLCASAPEVKAERDLELEAIKSRWGRGKREAREDRLKRKEGWGRGS